MLISLFTQNNNKITKVTLGILLRNKRIGSKYRAKVLKRLERKARKNAITEEISTEKSTRKKVMANDSYNFISCICSVICVKTSYGVGKIMELSIPSEAKDQIMRIPDNKISHCLIFIRILSFNPINILYIVFLIIPKEKKHAMCLSQFSFIDVPCTDDFIDCRNGHESLKIAFMQIIQQLFIFIACHDRYQFNAFLFFKSTYSFI